ncbi:MAG TPA: nucleoside/nucleotide kinase family protein [Chloroflexota bacterium]
MTSPTRVTRFAELCLRARTLAANDGRVLLGITGPPGSGKSTLARAIVGEVGSGARLVGMDGFHLSQARLRELGLLDRKGAIDTFDGAGFVTLVRRLRNPVEDVVYAPEFRRDLEESIAGSIPVERDVHFVVVEGNYLLVSDAPWGELFEMFDEVWYCEPDEDVRLANLIARHRAYGKPEHKSRLWALGSDQRNAEFIATTRSRADVIVHIDGQLADWVGRTEPLSEETSCTRYPRQP